MSFKKRYKILKGITLFSLLVLMFACQQKDKVEEEISAIPIRFEVSRFDRAFAKAKPEDLPRLKQKYPQFFPVQYPDSVWINMMTDSLYRELNTEVEKAFPDLDLQKEELKALFQHLKYYYPDFEAPHVYTLISEVDYDNKVILNDSLLLIGLDNYLGSHHHFYEGIQRYFSINFTKEQILPDVAEAYAKQKVPRSEKRALIDFMIYYGKILYFKQQMLPGTPLASIMGYTEEQWEWAEDNERQIWGYFMEREYLFDTEFDLRRRFLKDGPFTRFGLELDNESPARLGQYIGWKIVNRYVEKNKNQSLNEILKLDSRELFNKANYKPKQND